MTPAISVKHLTKDYGNGRGVFDVSFDVRQGELFGFVGTNGSGKTTTCLLYTSPSPRDPR